VQRSLLFQFAVSDVCVLILSIFVNIRGLLTIFKEGARNGFRGAMQRASRTPHGTQYTHHNLKHMLPQHCITYKDVFLLIIPSKV
jgi:hypothetical protein